MKDVDLVTTEIIRNSFTSIANDMNATLIRSAFSPVIYEGQDCAVALLDENGNVLGQSMGIALFLGTLDMCVKLIAEDFGWDYFREGDVFLLNDSYIAGTHLNDITIIVPIFWEGTRVGFAASRAHWIDVGAKDPGLPTDSHEIYQEGMRWGVTRIYENGKPRVDVIDLLRRNSRYGDAIIGDMNAQIAASETGISRVGELFSRFGLETIKAARDQIYRQTEEQERAEIALLPDGVYSAEGFLDSDGHGSDPLPVKVKVTISGSSISVDLSGTAEQSGGPVNCGYVQTCSAVRLAYKMLVCTNAEPNGGSFRTLDIHVPKGSMLAAQEPAACAWYFSSLGLMIDLVVKALSEVMPGRTAAAHYGDSMILALAGRHTRETPGYYHIEPTTGGWGGHSEGDGESSLINSVNGAFKDMPIELFEQKYPVRITSYGIRQDSGGAGKFRGGNGTFREYEVQSPSELSLWFERSKTTAWGLSGGSNGQAPVVRINKAGEKPVEMLKVSNFKLPPGSVVKTMTGGGGGYGSPFERDAKLVRDDVLDRHVSLDCARSVYGVAFTKDLEIDLEATRQLRA